MQLIAIICWTLVALFFIFIAVCVGGWDFVIWALVCVVVVGIIEWKYDKF